MRFFSKKTEGERDEEIITNLEKKFDLNSAYIMSDLKDSFNIESFSKIQDAEIAFFVMMSLEWGSFHALGVTERTRNILKKFENNIFDKYFVGAKVAAQKLFEIRYCEYGEILNSQDETSHMQIIHKFYSNFFSEEKDACNERIIMPKIIIHTSMLFLSFSKKAKDSIKDILTP